MNNRSLLLHVLLISSVANADEKPLDLDLDPMPFYQEAAKESLWMRDENYQSPEQLLSDQCLKMANEINALQGKPQRKFALQQRYEAECSK
ncbi:MAG: hypothetical protein ACU84H_03035 [Gammaproteobacteria bacterium]